MKQSQDLLWPSIVNTHIEGEKQGDQPKRKLYTHEQIKWLKEGLHATMDNTFEQASALLYKAFDQNDAQGFLQVWTD